MTESKFEFLNSAKLFFQLSVKKNVYKTTKWNDLLVDIIFLCDQNKKKT